MHIILFEIYLYNEWYANVGKGRWRGIGKTTTIFFCKRLADVYETTGVMGKGEWGMYGEIYLFMGKGERGMYEGNYLFVTKLYVFDAHSTLTHFLIHYYVMCICWNLDAI